MSALKKERAYLSPPSTPACVIRSAIFFSRSSILLSMVKQKKKDISSYDLVRHGLKLVLHVLQQRLHLQRSQRSVRIASRRIVPGCVIVILCVNTRTHVLRQLLHVLRIGAVAHPIAVDVLALVILFDIGHPRRFNRRGRKRELKLGSSGPVQCNGSSRANACDAVSNYLPAVCSLAVFGVDRC
ncbi:hypothetical protein ALC56_10309 [Trachymyrmex septentrionalis]|uniref:Uncharacterized protein n=1 Tax=Trachymyrmex septentrionalis TaxID=34720 RepID=A0A195F3H9_9HYME|nr:hypothetical protein ALC56_10309 [Trachymyrmex septentrionalis]